MKRYLKTILVVVILGILVGFINTTLVYEGFWQHFHKGLGSVPWFMHVLYAFLALFLAITAHEMGHFISFKHHGIQPKAIYSLGLALVDDEGWKLRFVPKFLLMVGGIVIPKHLTIHNKSEEEQMIEKFKKVLLAGPKASIIYGIGICVLWNGFLFFNIYWLNGFLFTMMVVTVLMTILAIMVSKVSRSGMYGDFAAKDAFEKDKLFRLTYLIQLTTLIEHDHESIDYFWPNIIDSLDKGSPHHALYTNLLGQYLYEVVFMGRIASTGIEKKLNRFINNPKKTEDGFILFLNIVYYYESMHNRNKVLSLLNTLDTTQFNINPKIRTYYLKLTNHLLKFSDESIFLNNPKNIHTSSLSWVYKPLNLKDDLKDIVK